MLIQDLSEHLYEDLNGQVVSMVKSNLGLLVTLECDDWENKMPRRRFLLSCADVRESTLAVSSVGWVKLVSEHPVLLAHNSEHSELFFSSAPVNPFEVIGRLMETHSTFYGHWRKLSEHLQASSVTLSGGHGLIARGPHLVMKRYAAAIDSLLEVNIVHSYEPKNKFKALIFEREFLVCGRIEAMEI